MESVAVNEPEVITSPPIASHSLQEALENCEPTSNEDVIEYPLIASSHRGRTDETTLGQIPDFLSLGLSESANDIIAKFFTTADGEKLMKICEQFQQQVVGEPISPSLETPRDSPEPPPTVWNG